MHREISYAQPWYYQAGGGGGGGGRGGQREFEGMGGGVLHRLKRSIYGQKVQY